MRIKNAQGAAKQLQVSCYNGKLIISQPKTLNRDTLRRQQKSDSANPLSVVSPLPLTKRSMRAKFKK
jgi:hypothetical protein